MGTRERRQLQHLTAEFLLRERGNPHHSGRGAPTNAFAVRNIYQKADAGAATLSIKGIADWPADTSMEALQKKGTLLIMCNNALNFWAMNVASATNQTDERTAARCAAVCLSFP